MYRRFIPFALLFLLTAPNGMKFLLKFSDARLERLHKRASFVIMGVRDGQIFRAIVISKAV